jgi:hypothetical protein
MQLFLSGKPMLQRILKHLVKTEGKAISWVSGVHSLNFKTVLFLEETLSQAGEETPAIMGRK